MRFSAWAVGLVLVTCGGCLPIYLSSKGGHGTTVTTTSDGKDNMRITTTSTQHPGPKVIGQGAVERRSFNVGPFSKVRADGFWDVEVVAGPKESLVISAQPNISATFEPRIENGVLRIQTTQDFESDQPIKVYITLPNMRGLDASGTGTVRVTGITGRDFDVDLSGSGDVFVQGDATKLKADSSGTGKLTMTGSGFGPTKVDLSGSGDVWLDGTLSGLDLQVSGTGSFKGANSEGQNVDIDISGSGDAELAGRAEGLKLSISGTGSANLVGLSVKSALVNLSGSGDTDIAVTDQLSVNASGTGSVRYKGSPRTMINKSGSGDVRSL